MDTVRSKDGSGTGVRGWDTPPTSISSHELKEEVDGLTLKRVHLTSDPRTWRKGKPNNFYFRKIPSKLKDGWASKPTSSGDVFSLVKRENRVEVQVSNRYQSGKKNGVEDSPSTFGVETFTRHFIIHYETI